MNKFTVIIGACIILAVAVVVLFVLPPNQANAPTGLEEEPSNFAECVAAGNPVMESYPRQCNTPSGGHFVEDIGNELEKQDLIQAAFPRPGSRITSPLVAEGEARGNWYFEASFPISIHKADGTQIGQGYAQAQGEWMTTEFVPFQSISIEFEPQPAGSAGTVILHKDNPSGLPEHDDELRIPVVF